MNSYYEKVAEFAHKYKSEGKIETAIGLYEEAGEASVMYIHEALNLSMRKGLLKRCIDLFRKHDRTRMANDLEESVRNKSKPIHTKLLDEVERNSVLENREDIPLGVKKRREINPDYKIVMDKKSFRNIDENRIKKQVNTFHYQN